MKSQSTVVRDLTEPAWREREADHVAKFVAAIPLVGTEGAQFKPSFGDVVAENKRLRDALAQQADMVEKCMVAMNENADKGMEAEAKLRAALGGPK
jgi:hypothetical protein